MSAVSLSEINIYPVKSAHGLSLDQARLVRRGLEHDRRWMLVDKEDKFLTQRQFSQMALIHPALEENALVLRAEGFAPFELPASLDDGPIRTVQVWEDQCIAVSAGDDADSWLSDVLGHEVRLVYMPDECERQVDETYARPGDITSFSDGFSLLLISEASLQDLNSRLEQPVPMRRFRPNLVVSGCAPFAEDKWRRIRIGNIEFEVAKPCSRCIIPTIDTETGLRNPEREPLRTLAGYRRRDNKVYFGQNLIHRGTGLINTGDPVEIIE
jgi:uncharacterized protein YcbX